MADNDTSRLEQLEARITLLERSLAISKPVLSGCRPMWPAALLVMACLFGFYGLGLPNHYYQPIFALLVCALFYHREFLSLYENSWRWLLATLNLAVMSLFFRLIIGGGEARPFAWIKIPSLEKQQPKEGSGWFDSLSPDYDLVWREAATADWSVNITQIQTILLLATLIGGLFRFQPFASFTAILLLVVSVPAFLIYDWNWVILFLITGSTGLYLQTGLQQK